ncbi:MAG: hypothetical protein JOZ92_03775 [Candidatus Dormibacteraeota bacterium]|nr:hypothetical protein [Candidatus Dormibacteraeota bacterium]
MRDAKYVEWDARSIYMLHARWLFAGHDYLLAAMANPAFAFSHAEYPPLLPSTIAVVWQLGGHVDLRLGELVTTALNLASCSLLGCAVAGVLGRHLRVLGIAAGGVIAAAAMGIAGAGGIDGYADLLAAVPVAAAAVYGLVHPRSRHALSLCVIALLVSALTKDEGLVAGGIVLVLVLVRYWTLVPPRRIERSMIALGVGGAIALMAAWPVAARIVGVPSELQTGAVAPFLSTATPISRVGPTVSALASYWVFLPWVAATSIAALLALRAGRARLSLGGSVWLWLVIVLAGGSLAITYIVGPYDISWWLRTSVDRTTMFVQVLLLSEVIVCGLVAVSCGAAAIGSWRHRAGAA